MALCATAGDALINVMAAVPHSVRVQNFRVNLPIGPLPSLPSTIVGAGILIRFDESGEIDGGITQADFLAAENILAAIPPPVHRRSSYIGGGSKRRAHRLFAEKSAIDRFQRYVLLMLNAAGKVTRPTSIDTALWLDRHGAALRRFFRRRVNPADVDDLVQDVLLKLQTTVGAEEIASADRYLFSVARSVLVDRLRAERAHDLNEYERYASIDGVIDRLSPERIVLARDAYDHARQAVSNLPPRARMAFEYHRFEYMTYKEIAARMRISRESVKELVHRALIAVIAELRRSETHGE